MSHAATTFLILATISITLQAAHHGHERKINIWHALIDMAGLITVLYWGGSSADPMIPVTCQKTQ